MKQYVLLLLLVNCCFCLLAQSLHFDQLSVENGLSQNTVNCLQKDHRGYLWIGTNDGLNRYNGYEFEWFRYQNEQANSLSDNKIYALLEDRNQRLWIGTSRGLNVYNQQLDRFEHIPMFDKAFIRHLVELENGELWVATLNGQLFRSDASKTQFERVYFPDQFQINEVSYLLPINEKELLVATNLHGVFSLTTDQLNWQFTTLPNEFGNSSKVLFQDTKAQIWIGTQGFGVWVLDENKAVVQHFSTQNGSLKNDIIKAITSDEKGNIWMATDGAGIAIFDGQNIQYLTQQLEKSTPLISNAVYSIYKDKEDILWVGTFDSGIGVVNPYKEKFNYLSTNYQANKGLSHRAVLSFLETDDGDIWIGTDGGGLNLFDRKQQRFSYFNSKSTTSFQSASDVVTALFEDSEKRIWLGTYLGGLQAWHPTKGSIEIYQHQPKKSNSIRNNNVWAIEEAEPGQLLIGTLEGLDLFEVETETFLHIKTVGGNYKERITELYKDRGGKIWVGGQGVRYYNPTKQILERLPEALEQQFQQLDTRAFYDDSRGNFWIGTEGGGLFLLDRTRLQLQQFNTSNGLSSNSIHTIEEDENGQIWLSTNNGLVRFDPSALLKGAAANTSFAFKTYHQRDGLQSNQFSYNASLRARDGTLFFGGINGFNYFRSDQIKDNPFVPNIEITGLKIFDQYVEANVPESPLSASIEQTKTLELDHKQSQLFTLEFTALNFTSSEKNQYAYQLEGFLEDWNYIGTRRSATFTNLNPGTYIFRVKAANNDGVWNANPTELKLIIHPPFWKSAWAYVFYISIFIGLLMAFRATLLFRERLKNSVQLKELEKEKLEELNQMKLAFFTDISHEFRTPLTLIAAPIEHLLEEEKTLSPQVTQQLNLVQRNTNRLLRLVNQLLEFRKINDNKTQLKLSEVDLVSYLSNLKELFDDLAKRLNIDFQFRTNTAQLSVQIDQDKLETIIYNLLSNAFKYAEQQVVLEIIDNKDATFQMCIIDDGIGIAESEQTQIFDRFYRANRGQGRSMAQAATPGTGIGLAFVKALVELHQGNIDLDSQPQHGCTFTVTLPQYQNGDFPDYLQTPIPTPTAEKVELPTVNEALVQTPINTELPILLVVEDHKEVRQFIRDSFKNEFQIIEAENGKKGVKFALEQVPDFIISDITMPKMDGLELCQTLKKDNRTSHIPILLLTASTNEERWMKGLETGADDYMTKPFKLRVLKARIQNIMEGRNRLRQHFSRTFLTPTDESVPSSDDQFLQNAVSVIEANLDNTEFGVSQLARELGLSRSVLYRKFSALIDQPVKEFINVIRMKRAAQLLRQDVDLPIAEIAYRVGFSDARYFSKKFKKFYLKTPTQYLEEQQEPEV